MRGQRPKSTKTNLKYLKTRVFMGFLAEKPKLEIFQVKPKRQGAWGKNPKTKLKFLKTRAFWVFLIKNPKFEIFQVKT